MKEQSEILARFIYPKPKGVTLFAEDLITEDAVVQLFNACQIFQGLIYAKGWAFLYQHYGLERLYLIDQTSEWFNTDDKGEWLESILDWALISGFNLQTGHFGVFNKGKNQFTTDNCLVERIDWMAFRGKFGD